MEIGKQQVTVKYVIDGITFLKDETWRQVVEKDEQGNMVLRLKPIIWIDYDEIEEPVI